MLLLYFRGNGLVIRLPWLMYMAFCCLLLAAYRTRLRNNVPRREKRGHSHCDLGSIDLTAVPMSTGDRSGGTRKSKDMGVIIDNSVGYGCGRPIKWFETKMESVTGTFHTDFFQICCVKTVYICGRQLIEDGRTRVPKTSDLKTDGR